MECMTKTNLILKSLSDEREEVKYAVSGVDPEILSELANDDEFDVRIAIAVNDLAPEEVLEILANDEEEDIRCMTAMNENTSKNALAILS